jgi:hypothetical protein
MSDHSESLNESGYYFIVPFFEPGQISDLHRIDAREEVINGTAITNRTTDYGICWQ